MGEDASSARRSLPFANREHIHLAKCMWISRLKRMPIIQFCERLGARVLRLKLLQNSGTELEAEE